MNHVQILDCTLRDGGRIINCEFPNRTISEMTQKLVDSGIDIVEVGFLRDKKLVNYTGDSTFFTETAQIKPFIPSNLKNTMCVAFIDFNMYDFSALAPCDDKTITGLRVGFTKKQYDTQRDEIIQALMTVKKLGYKLMVQGVNSLAYTDRELLDLIDLLNEVEPYSFGIVDTYGAMYLDDMIHYYDLIDYNLKKDILIDIHSHNNFQLSFAFAQQIIALSENKRNIILDATLNGMGKCAGNLNTELIVDYLVKKQRGNYDFEGILDIIDDYLDEIKKEHSWGYSIPAFMAGVYKAHPNNVIYLTSKHRMNTKDIGNILCMIDEEKRQRYDYDELENKYIEYNTDAMDDTVALSKLKEAMSNKEILLIAPGHTIVEHKEEINQYVETHHPVIISVNFYSDYENSFVFWGNPKRFSLEEMKTKENYEPVICSNVYREDNELCIVNFFSLIWKGYKYFDNSVMMCLKLLKKLDVKEIVIAGFDGFDTRKENNYMDETFHNDRYIENFREINEELTKMLRQLEETMNGKCKISLLTPSLLKL